MDTNIDQPVTPPTTPAPEIPTAPVVVTPTSPKKFDPRELFSKIKIPKKILISVAIALILLVVLVIVSSMLGQKRGGVAPQITETPAPTEEPISEIPSQYADDPDVAEIKKQMDELDQDLDEASFRDDTLRSPTLDWKVEFDD